MYDFLFLYICFLSDILNIVPKPATPTNVSGETTSIPTQQVIVGTKCYQIPTNVYESFNGAKCK